MMKLFKIFWLLMGLSVIVFNLFSGQEVERVDDVPIIHNDKEGKWGKNPRVAIEFVKTIGELETEDENLAFHMPSDVAVDLKSSIFVLDSGNHRIQKFDFDGNYLTTIGNKGQGPAEFYFPISLDVDSEGLLYVSDPQNQRIQILNPDGTEYKTVKVIKEPPGIIRVLNSGDLLMGKGGLMIGFGVGMEESGEQPDLMEVLDLEGNILRTFVRPLDYKNTLMNRMGNGIHFATDESDNIYVTFDYQNRIEKYSADGKLLWRSDRKLNYSPTPPGAKSGMEKRKGGMVEIRMPQMNRCSNGIAVDEKGRVWVVTLKRQIKEDEQVQTSVGVRRSSDGTRSMSLSVSGNVENRETDIYQLELYSPEGVLLGAFPLSHFVDDIRIQNDRLFLLDKMRGAQYYEYKIIEK